MKKRVVLLIALVVVIAGCASQPNNLATQQQKKSQSIETIQGKVSYYYTGDSYFTLVDEDIDYTIYIPSSQVLEMGSYVEIQGEFIDATTFDAQTIKKLGPAEEREYFKKRFPLLEIKILQHPSVVANKCAIPKFILEIKNIGKEPITHQQLHIEEYTYGIFYFIDDQPSIAHSTRSNYQEVFDSIPKDQLPLITMLSNKGITYFEDIKPGETKQIEFWGGGGIEKNDLGTAGIHNIFGNKKPGTYTISFAWTKNKSYFPSFLMFSNSVSVQLASDGCL